jgi:hypothetical protein
MGRFKIEIRCMPSIIDLAIKSKRRFANDKRVLSDKPSIFTNVKCYIQHCVEELLYTDENPYADLRDEKVFKIVFDTKENKEICINLVNAFSYPSPGEREYHGDLDEGGNESRDSKENNDDHYPIPAEEGDAYYPVTDLIQLPTAQLQYKPMSCSTTTLDAL